MRLIPSPLSCAFSLILVIASGLIGKPAVCAESQEILGRAIEDFTLDNCYGKSVSLSDFGSRKAIALVFLGTECPLAKLYGPKLQEMQDRYQDAGVQIIGINSNKQDSLTEVAAYVHHHELKFPMLKDVGNVVADRLGAERTPEVFLLDADFKIRYHGRIDDQYGVGYTRERQAEPELTLAIDQLLAGEPVDKPLTKAVGCHIGRVKSIEPTGEITFTKHIAPILNSHCVSCHRDGEIAPFTLTSYEDVLGWEDTILEVIEDRRMPPWSADPAHGNFKNDPRLSAKERELLETWIDNGMPQGDPADLPPPPKFAEGWQIDEPDEIIKMRTDPFDVPADGIIDYKHFVVDPGWKEDRYIVAAEARPDCRSVVHHILVYVIPPNSDKRDPRQIIAGYAPGAVPTDLSDGIAIRVEAGSKLEFEMHYTPNGSEQKDLSYLGLRFTDKKNVRKLLRGGIAANDEFLIPRREANHKVVAWYVARQDELLLSMTPHMHLRGKSFKYVAQFPDKSEKVLLDVPNYDFNWQLKYILTEPMQVPRGTRIKCTAYFDNGVKNLTNPDPSVDVTWGDQSSDEMMIGFMETVSVEDDF